MTITEYAPVSSVVCVCVALSYVHASLLITPQLRWFAVDDFARLELFIKSCPLYANNFYHHVLVVLSYLGLYIYVFLSAVAAYDRTVFHRLGWLGILITEVVVSYTTPEPVVPSTYTTPVCAPHAPHTPARAVALTTFAAMYYALHELFIGGRSRFWFIAMCAWLLAVIYLSMLAQVELHLHTVDEAVQGGALGVMSGVLTGAIAFGIVQPHFRAPAVQKLTRWSCLDSRNFG
jgi:hypothetical protein